MQRPYALPRFVRAFYLLIREACGTLTTRMKPPLLIVLAAGLAALLSAPDAIAQLRGARNYTRRVAPDAPPPAPVRNTPPVVVPLQPAPQPVDPAKAKVEKEELTKRTVEFQKKRAEGGSPSAQYDLGVRYITGDGVEKNLATARKWITAASTNGHYYASKKLIELTKIEEAEKTAKKASAASDAGSAPAVPAAPAAPVAAPAAPAK